MLIYDIILHPKFSPRLTVLIFKLRRFPLEKIFAGYLGILCLILGLYTPISVPSADLELAGTSWYITIEIRAKCLEILVHTLMRLEQDV